MGFQRQHNVSRYNRGATTEKREPQDRECMSGKQEYTEGDGEFEIKNKSTIPGWGALPGIEECWWWIMSANPGTEAPTQMNQYSY